MIYFDNAATGGFKPYASISAAENVIHNINANPGRSGHYLSILGAKNVNTCRENVAKMFGAQSQRVIFTKNCTEALNLAIFGCYKKGGRVITTCYEHNSVLRPLYYLQSCGLISLDIACPEKDKPLYKIIEEKINKDVCLIVCSAISNVTGEILPIEQIGRVAQKNNIPYLIDGAQGGGHIQLDINECHASMIALAGHKGLYGIMGSGILVLNNHINLKPLIFGGTGTETFNLSQPSSYPEYLESGTLNLPAIASLSEGINFVSRNINNFSETLLEHTKKLIFELVNIKSVKCYSFANPAGIVAFSLNNCPSNELADILNCQFDIGVRGGFHCAPLTHKYLGTSSDGLVRVSLAVQNNLNEINYFIKSIKTISKQIAP